MDMTVRKLNSKLELSQLLFVQCFDKENLIEFPLDFLHYLYNYYMVCALLSHAYHVTCYVMWHCDILWCDCDTFPHSLLCSESKIKGKEKKKKYK